MQARLAALQPPVLADRRLGQRAARPDREQRERAQRLVLARRRRVEHVLRDHALGQVVLPLEALAAPAIASSPAVPERLEHHLRRLPVPHPAAAAAPSKSREPSGPSSRIRSSTGSTRSAWSRIARSCEPQCPEPVHHVRKCGHSSIGSSEASCAQYSKMRPSRSSSARCRPGRADPRRDRQAVRAVDRGDRVELHRGQPPDHVLDVAVAPRAESATRNPGCRRRDAGSQRALRPLDVRRRPGTARVSAPGARSRPGRPPSGLR